MNLLNDLYNLTRTNYLLVVTYLHLRRGKGQGNYSRGDQGFSGPLLYTGQLGFNVHSFLADRREARSQVLLYI
jgi:hypothetical protein